MSEMNMILTHEELDEMLNDKIQKKKNYVKRQLKNDHQSIPPRKITKVCIATTTKHISNLLCLFCSEIASIELYKQGDEYKTKIGNLCEDCYDVIKHLPKVGERK
jgi:hypothetical protein